MDLFEVEGVGGSGILADGNKLSHMMGGGINLPHLAQHANDIQLSEIK